MIKFGHQIFYMSIFNDTKIAFADRSTAQLEKAKWMFTAIQHPSLTNFWNWSS